MRALIYKKIKDSKTELLLTSFLIMFYFYLGFDNIFPMFWILVVGRTETPEEMAYLRTLNFSKKDFFKSAFIFNAMKLLFRISLILVMIPFINKGRDNIIYALFFLYIFFIIEIARDTITIDYSGIAYDKVMHTVKGIFIFLIVVAGLVWLLESLFWPMERLVYGSMYLTAAALILIIYNYVFYKGVHYVES